MREEQIFVTGFCRQYMTSVLDPKPIFFTDEDKFQLSRRVSTQNNWYWSSINLTHLLKCPFTIRRLVCGVPLLLHE
jgi:hypothetical protein